MENQTLAEDHIKNLKKLSSWLKRNPNKSKLVEDEAAAVDYAIERLEEQGA